MWARLGDSAPQTYVVSVAVSTLILANFTSDVGDGVFYWSMALHRISVAEFPCSSLRYERQQIYTWLGDVLVSVNPYSNVGAFDEDTDTPMVPVPFLSSTVQVLFNC